MSNTVIVDGNSVGYAAHDATKLRSGDMETQAIYGFLRTIRQVALDYPGYEIIVLWDGRAQWRYDLHPTYKSKRNNDPVKAARREAYVKQRPYISQALAHLGVRQLTDIKQEADDVAGYLVRRIVMKDPHAKVVLITGDKDWVQLLLTPNVTWRDLRDDSRLITLDNFMDKTGFANPMAFLEGKCLQGDSSDDIPGVGQIGEERATHVLAEFGSVREFWRRCDSGEHAPKLKRMIALASQDGRRRFLRNLRLMQLHVGKQPDPKNVRMVKGEFNPEKFIALCEELAFASILRQIEAFLHTFDPATRH